MTPMMLALVILAATIVLLFENLFRLQLRQYCLLWPMLIRA